VHVSSDGLKFIVWDTYTATSQAKGEKDILYSDKYERSNTAYCTIKLPVRLFIV
jgi:hypothetical protein